jgi:hypothetical protein
MTSRNGGHSHNYRVGKCQSYRQYAHHTRDDWRHLIHRPAAAWQEHISYGQNSSVLIANWPRSKRQHQRHFSSFIVLRQTQDARRVRTVNGASTLFLNRSTPQATTAAIPTWKCWPNSLKLSRPIHLGQRELLDALAVFLNHPARTSCCTQNRRAL